MTMNFQYDVHTTPDMYDHSSTRGHMINAYKTLTLPKLALFIVVLLMTTNAVRWLRFRPAQLTDLDREALARFRLFIRLAAAAYHQPSIGIIRETHEGWENLSNLAGKIWLWRKKEARQYAIVIRGTATFCDLGEDCRLLWTSYLQHDHSQWAVAVDQVLQEIQVLLKENNVSSRAELVVVGHSLGAVYAECALHALRQQSRRRISAVTFDSPGIPFSYRHFAKMPPRLKGLTSLNAPANAVNMLNRSCAERLYYCGNGADLTFDIAMATVRLISCSWWYGFHNLIDNNVDHRLDRIQHYLASGRITRTSVERWPSWFRSSPSSRQQSLAASAQAPPAPQARGGIINRGRWTAVTGAVATVATWLRGIAGWQAIPCVGPLASTHIVVMAGGQAVTAVALGPVVTVGSAMWTCHKFYRNRNRENQ